MKRAGPLTVGAVASGGPLPPNRRVRAKRSPEGTVRAPDGAWNATSQGDGAREPGAPNAALTAAERSAAERRLRDALAAAFGILATMAMALACVWGLVRYTRQSPRFAIKTVEAHGAVQRTGADLARQGGIEPGQNIFSVDLERARLRMLSDPWIEQVNLVRRLPRTLVVDVVEREAAALLAIGADLYLVTRKGEPFKKLETSDPFDYPVVTGVRAEEVAEDRGAVVAAVRRGLELAQEYERTNTSKSLPVQEIHLEDDGGISLTVGKEPVVLYFGSRGPYRQAVEQACRVLAEVANRRAQASVVFLDNEAHPERVVVRMR